MEDDVAARDGVDEGAAVSDVTVCEFDVSAAGEGGEIARRADEGADGVAVPQKGGAEPSAEIAGCAGHKYLLHPLGFPSVGKNLRWFHGNFQ